MEKSNTRIEMLKAFLNDDPGDDFSQYALALEYEKAGRPGDAIMQLDQILSRNADYLAAYYQLGNLLSRAGDVPRAMHVYETGMGIAGRQQNLKTLNELRAALEMLDPE